jgi:hypothetical protein
MIRRNNINDILMHIKMVLVKVKKIYLGGYHMNLTEDTKLMSIISPILKQIG